MRLRTALLGPAVVALLAPLLVGLGPSAGAQEAPRQVGPLTGRLLSASTPNGAVAGRTVLLRDEGDGSPGAIVATGTTAADGRFALTAGKTTTGRVWVQVLGSPRWQGGWVGGTTRYVQLQAAWARTYPVGSALGEILMLPAFMVGKVVNPATGIRVRGATVRIFGVDTDVPPQRVDTTDNTGTFAVTGLVDEEFHLRVLGPAGYESGWVGCAYNVVASAGLACTHAAGRLPWKVRLQHS